MCAAELSTTTTTTTTTVAAAATTSHIVSLLRIGSNLYVLSSCTNINVLKHQEVHKIITKH